MSRNAISPDDLAEFVVLQPETFRTRDVADYAELRARYPELVSAGTYNASIGGALSDHRDTLGIALVKQGGGRGATWQRVTSRLGVRSASERVISAPALASSATPCAPASESRPTSGGSLDLGPQYALDPPFTARMRLHQSWYRAQVLGVPCGTGPQAHHDSRYGNMLTTADGSAGKNLLTPEIAALARRRVAAGGGVEPYRLFHNMLSSQPMCFNLFGPLVGDLDLAARCLRQILDTPIEAVERVELEWAPQPAEHYLADRTSFDAFIEYRRPDGRLGFLGIETKLTEAFSGTHYDRAEYRRWMASPSSPWLPTAAGEVDAVRHNQLWRDHLLAIALRDRPGSSYAEGGFALVRHPGDTACAQVVAGYRSLLRPQDASFRDLPLDRLVGAFDAAASTESQRGWLAAFRTRYLDLARSDAVNAARSVGAFTAR